MGQKSADFTLSHLQTIPPAAIPLTFTCTKWWRPYLFLGLCEWLCRHQYRPPRASLLHLCTSRQAFAPPFPDGTKAWGRLQEKLQSWCSVGSYPFCIRSHLTSSMLLQTAKYIFCENGMLQNVHHARILQMCEKPNSAWQRQVPSTAISVWDCTDLVFLLFYQEKRTKCPHLSC